MMMMITLPGVVAHAREGGTREEAVEADVVQRQVRPVLPRAVRVRRQHEQHVLGHHAGTVLLQEGDDDLGADGVVQRHPARPLDRVARRVLAGEADMPVPAVDLHHHSLLVVLGTVPFLGVEEAGHPWDGGQELGVGPLGGETAHQLRHALPDRAPLLLPIDTIV